MTTHKMVLYDFKWILVLVTEHELIFSKAEKLHEPVGQVQFEVFEKFTSAYSHQIA